MNKILKKNKSAFRKVFRNIYIDVKCLASHKDPPKALGNAYVPREIEQESYGNDFYFHSNRNQQKSFTLLLPPPNITGTLHLGHAFAVTIQDVLVRWNRMKGISTLWIPGLDHAGIATQVIVEKKIWTERRQTRYELGRDQFVKEILKWKDEKANIINKQLRQMAASVDWSKQVFTMDAKQSYAVVEAFIKLYESGLIYRSDYLVNWSCLLQSAIADIEVEHMEVSGSTMISVPGYERPVEFGIITKFTYKICDSDEEIVVATTRPETILGDTGIAVHPEDERYSSFIGRMCWHPFRNDKIPIICDTMVDRNFGTGAVKITPAHDHADFEVAKRHGLNVLQVIDEKGYINCAQFENVRRFDARNIIIDKLQELGLLRGRHDHPMAVPICSRSRDVVEYLLKPQWFLKCKGMADLALRDVKEGNLQIEPKQFERDWNNWLENIRDWCISRQLWWGHRIPMYLCSLRVRSEDKCYIAAHDLEAAKAKAAVKFGCHSNDVIAEQDEDTLDTWFSSALLPFSVFGWPEQTDDLKRNYPLSLMETGHDILFFWVARMVMLGTFLTGQLPFSKVLLHGIICDAQGRKMSKSLGNVIAPENVIFGSSLEQLEKLSKDSFVTGVLTKEEYRRALNGQKKMFPEGIPDCGSDALRFTLCSHNVKNHYISFNVQECKINKFFGNKIWQAVKFTNKWIDHTSEMENFKDVKYEELSKIDQWILSRLTSMVQTVNESLEKYEFHVSTNALKHFLYYEFCDVFLEAVKRGLRQSDGIAASKHCWTLSMCLDVGLRSLAPFMPRLSEHLHKHLLIHRSLQRRYDFPEKLQWSNIDVEKEVEHMMDVIISIRRLKKIFNLTAKDKFKVILENRAIEFGELLHVIEDLTKCDYISIERQLNCNMQSEAISEQVGPDITVHLLLSSDIRNNFKSDLSNLEIKRNKLFIELNKIKDQTSTEAYKLKASAASQEANSRKILTLEQQIVRIDYIQKISRSL